MVDAAHAVERVREDRRAGVEGGERGVEVGAGVADGDADACGGEAADRVGGTVVLGRDRDLAQRAGGGLEQQVDGCRVGRPQQGRVVRAAELGVEERALEVRAEHARVALPRSGRSSRDPGGERPTPAVTSESTERVVPCALCTASAVSIAGSPSSTEAPPAPWQWMSMNPGTSKRPAASVTARLGREPVAPAVADAARDHPVAVEAHPRVGDGVGAAHETRGVDDDGGVLTSATITS